MKSSFPLVERNLQDRHRGIGVLGPLDFPLVGVLKRYWPSDGVDSSVFQARFPDAQLLVRMGRRAVKRRIRYWHPWHMEQTHSDYTLSKKIDWFTPPNGDHEWIESLVRFDHMIDLAAAHRLTSKQRYVKSFVYYLKSFADSRSTPGRHWQYKLNPAIRVINLIRAYDLVARRIAPDDPVHRLVCECILRDVEFLKTQVDDARGNGAFFVACALLIAALYFEDLFKTHAWRDSAESKLFEALRTEIRGDGVEAEQVPMYHGEVLLTLLDYCVALTSNGCSIDCRLRTAARAMLAVIGKVSDPQGLIPPIGDSDRFDVNYLYEFYNSVLNERASLEKDWMPLEAESSARDAAFQVQKLSETGWVVVRWNHDEGHRGYLLFDCSGKPRPGYGSHSHADDLQFLLHDSRGPIFTDPGRFTYCTEFKAFFPWSRKRINPHGRFKRVYELLFPDFMALARRNWKEYFKGTLSHNTVSCDGANQPGYSHPRDVGATVKLGRHLACGPLIYLDGVLACDNSVLGDDASTQYSHRRALIGFHPDLWVIVDRVEGAQAHQWISSFHVDFDCRISSSAEFQFIEVNGGVHQFFGASVMDGDGADCSIDDDWVSPLYNLKRPSKTIRIRSQQSATAELVGVVYTGTTRYRRIQRIDLIPVHDASGDMITKNILIHLVRDEVVTRILVNSEGFDFCDEDFCSDAMVAFVSHSGGELVEAGLLGGRYLKCRDTNLVASEGADVLHYAIS